LTSRAAEALRRRRVAQAAERLVTGPAWTRDERWAGLVFTSRGRLADAPVEHASIVAAACRRAGVPALTPYELRHTAASLLVDAGASACAVADQLGHTTTRMLDAHYHHRVAEVVDTAAAAEVARATPN
jgi:integrase